MSTLPGISNAVELTATTPAYSMTTDGKNIIAWNEWCKTVKDIAGFSFSSDGTKLRIQNIKEKYPQIFDWLNLTDMNVWVILIIITLVAGFNMVSGLLILILGKNKYDWYFKSYWNK